MSELDLDMDTDAVGDGLGLPPAGDEDVTQTVEGQEQGGPPSEPGDKEEADLSDQQFVYTTSEGEEIKGTVTEIAEKLAEMSTKGPDDLRTELQALKEKLEQVQKPAEKPAEAGLPYEIRQIDLRETGNRLQTMLEGGDPDRGIGGLENLGEELKEFQFQNFAQDNRISDLIYRFVNGILDEREQGSKKSTAFNEFAGAEAQETEIAGFMKDNPWASTKEMAVLGLQLAAQRKEIADLKSGKVKEVQEAAEKGKKAGAEETVKHLKAKGTLRAMGGPGGTPRQPGPSGSFGDIKAKYDITDPDQRSRAMAEGVIRMRGGG